jgi:N-methylhydantoinase B
VSTGGGAGTANGQRRTANGLDAIDLAVMAHAFAGVAEEMGAALVASAFSPNIRERRDSSAALFDADGRMVAQAAHIPVHLGAMPEAVAAVRALRPRPGETYILNDPYTGGTHLPDITLVHAVAVEDVVGGYTVVRAHHSDVGGSRPGSMPPDSRSVFEEGIVIPPTRWAADGAVDRGVERFLLANVRTPDMRRGDLAAQLAACERGADRYRALVSERGRDYVEVAGRELLDYAERRTLASLVRAVPNGVYEARDWLEGDGVDDADIELCVRITAEGGRLTCDFTGTAAAVRGNVNCPISVTRAAALFVVRCLVEADIPTNGGVQRVVTVNAPEGCLVNARWPSAVAAGNVETSQRITDLLFSALEETGAPAQGQGTMNNIVFGGDGWTYYETLGGGQGASATGDGPTGVHVGMSNTRNTPIEAFELDHPMRIRRYGVRRDSGGQGAHRGGDGVVREYEALAPAEVSVISERRRHAPRGTRGGSDGQPGRNAVNDEELGGRIAVTLQPGDVLRIETPGGGGWGGAVQ